MANESSDNAASSDDEPGTGTQDRQRQQYETIIRILPYPVYALDKNGYLTFTNPAFDDQFGYKDREKTEGLHFSEITTDAGADTVRSHLRDLVGESQNEITSRGFELEGLTADGRTLALEGSIGLLPHTGTFDGAAGIMRDVTTQKRQEEVFEVMDRALRHNLRTVVNLINGYADLLETEVGEDNAEYLVQIQDGANWLGKLGETLRTLKTAIDESLETSQAPNVEEVVTSAVETVRDAHSEASIESHFAAHGKLEAGGPLVTALENVIENGIVHNDADDPAVNVWVNHSPREGWIEIHIEDNGPGIPKEECDIVLGNTDITQLQHGSGIGLWITRWVIQVFNGEVDIEANESRGTVVTLQLPLADQKGKDAKE